MNSSAIDAATVNVRECDDTQKSLWDAFVDSYEGSSLYHNYAWGELIEDLFGHKVVRLAAWQEDAIVGVLPVVQMKSRLFGNSMFSLPYFNYGGCAADEPIATALMSRAGEIAAELGSGSVEFRDVVARPGWPVREDKVSMILELPESREALGKSIGSKKRSQVKRPLRENPEIEIGGVELLGEFYKVFAHNMRDLGTPVYSIRLFEEILQRFSDSAKIVIIRLEGEPVSTAFLLSHRDTLEIPWAATLRSVNRLSVNMLLYWEVLGYAIESGFKFFDFGRSTVDAGTYRFKKQWGAQPKQLYWHYWLEDGKEIPKLNHSNPKFELLINIWQRLPVPVANILGPPVVKNLP